VQTPETSTIACAKPPSEVVIPQPTLPPPSSLALDEAQAFAGGDEWKMRHAKLRSMRDLILSIALFVFVLGLNLWWDFAIAKWVRLSGTQGSNFHLSDSVLIALTTTSVANFVGLLVIVARHLFPSTNSKSE
jgi:hypothetical protein